jgi:hypothetical protein
MICEKKKKPATNEPAMEKILRIGEGVKVGRAR